MLWYIYLLLCLPREKPKSTHFDAPPLISILWSLMNIIVFEIPFNDYIYSSSGFHWPPSDGFFQERCAHLNSMFKSPLPKHTKNYARRRWISLIRFVALIENHPCLGDHCRPEQMIGTKCYTTLKSISQEVWMYAYV